MSVYIFLCCIKPLLADFKCSGSKCILYGLNDLKMSWFSFSASVAGAFGYRTAGECSDMRA